MATPVIIDDGGSTRIRLVTDGRVTEFPLLHVSKHGESPWQATQTLPGPYDRIKGLSIGHHGDETPVVDRPLIDGDNVTIASDHDQLVTATIDGKGQCKIVVKGSVDNPPLIEVERVNGEVCYAVSNAGRIQTIDGVANGEEFHFVATAGRTSYTTLIIGCEAHGTD